MSHFHGPKTERGKARSSQNAIRHGLTGRVVVLPSEDMEVYQAFSKELVDSLNPATPLEKQLAQTVSDTQWRLNRARTYEDGMLALGQDLSPQNRGEDDACGRALSAAKVFRDNSKAFVNLSLYEQRLSRQQKDALRQLRDLQAERKAAQPLASVPAPEMRLPAASAAATSASEQPAEFVYSNGRACALDGQALSRQMPDQGSEAVVGEYDPGAFDPIFFKRSVPVRFIEKEAA